MSLLTVGGTNEPVSITPYPYNILLGRGHTGAGHTIRVQDAKRANEGEKFNVLISNTDDDYLMMLKELHLNYTINKLTESISEVVFNV